MNCRVVADAEAVIVHSEWSRSRLVAAHPTAMIARVPMGVLPGASGRPEAAAQPSGVTTIASFGQVTPEKGIEQVLRALVVLKAEHELRYVLVGETSPYFDIGRLIRDYGLTDLVVRTGHVSLAEFERWIAATDVAVNLRGRPLGETSASLCRIMAAGVLAIVSDAGWFSELPDDVAVKIDVGDVGDALLLACLRRLVADPALRERIGANARQYVEREHRIEASAEAYIEVVRAVAARRVQRRLAQSVATEAARLGIEETDLPFLGDLARHVAEFAPSIDATSSPGETPPQAPPPSGGRPGPAGARGPVGAAAPARGHRLSDGRARVPSPARCPAAPVSPDQAVLQPDQAARARRRQARRRDAAPLHGLRQPGDIPEIDARRADP